MSLGDDKPVGDGTGNGKGISMLLGLGRKGKYGRIDADLSNDGPRRGIESKRYIFACAIFASLNSVLLGYGERKAPPLLPPLALKDQILDSICIRDPKLTSCNCGLYYADVGVMSGCIIFIQKDLHITEVQQEVLVGCLSILSLVGSLAAGRTSDAIGRKWTIGLAAIIFQTGAAIMAFAPSFQVLILGRLLAGVGIGFGVMIAPVYIAEISPTVSRGSFTSFPEIFINLGILLGYISNYVFSGLSEHISWRIMLGIGILPSVFIGFALFVIPESPRWLVMQNRVEEARSVLMRINENDKEVEDRLREIEEAAGVVKGEKYVEKAVWLEFLRPSPTLRRMLITGIGIQCFQQITGIDATVYYSPTIFKNAGIESDSKLLAATVAVGMTKTAFILVAILLIDRVGRKPLLYVSTIGMTVCLFCLGLSLSLLGNDLVSPRVGILVAILAVCGNVAFFSVGIGPICWVLSSEIFPQRLRAQAVALGTVGNRLSSGLIAMSFLSMCRAITVAGTFFIFSAISAMSVIFINMHVPETKGKSLEQIEMLLDTGREWQQIEVELGDVEHLVQKD
ncbi:hypothetical protein GW17_00001016 [Ensete ventricosum]|nr:hypothetical protein GW17_00001016 [Ensete ventricosum]